MKRILVLSVSLLVVLIIIAIIYFQSSKNNDLSKNITITDIPNTIERVMVFTFSDSAKEGTEQIFNMEKAEAIGAENVVDGCVSIKLYSDVNNPSPNIRWFGNGEYYILCLTVNKTGEIEAYEYFHEKQRQKYNIENAYSVISFSNFSK